MHEVPVLDITSTTAFLRFRDRMQEHFPFVIVPVEIDANEFRKQKPLLFSIIVLAGVKSFRPDAPTYLADEIRRCFANRIVRKGEKSLEIVQCLLVYVCFSPTISPEHDSNLYQLVHLACTTALDLGLGRRAVSAGSGKDVSQGVGEINLDGQRAWLGCYYLAGTATINLRLPSFVRWSKYIEDCLDVLSTNSDANSSDTWLCALVHAHHIAENAAIVFSMDDPAEIITFENLTPNASSQL